MSAPNPKQMNPGQRSVFRAIRTLGARLAAFFDFSTSAENVLEQEENGKWHLNEPRQDLSDSDTAERQALRHARKELHNANERAGLIGDRLLDEYEKVDSADSSKTHERVSRLAHQTDRNYQDFARSLRIRLRPFRPAGASSSPKTTDSIFRTGVLITALAYGVSTCFTIGMEAKIARDELMNRTHQSERSLLLGGPAPSHSVVSQGYKDVRYVPTPSSLDRRKQLAEGIKTMTDGLVKAAKAAGRIRSGADPKILGVYGVPLRASRLGDKTRSRFEITGNRNVFDFGRFHVRYC